MRSSENPIIGVQGNKADLVMILVVLVILLQTNQASSIECIRRACDQEKPDPIVCNQSLILISDVTNWQMERNHVALAAMKSTCMGRESCDPSTVCSKSPHGTLYIHYVCEDAKNVFTSTCNNQVFEIPAQHGFIQSPNYPTTLTHDRPCLWRIKPPNDSLVLLKLHDITTSGLADECDGGLSISGLDCERIMAGVKDVQLCGRDNNTSIVKCGEVNIQSPNSSRNHPLRFWLEFRVLLNQKASAASSGLTCSGRERSTDAATAKNSAMVPKETDTKLLIILLSVISSLSGLLIIVLVVVCIRCRLMRMTVSDHVYCEPSPALQAHYDYISSLETDKPPPELADEYFEVADALPYNLRTTPASPAYAEVEQFIDFKRGPHSSVDSIEWADCQSQCSNADGVTQREEAASHDSPGKLRTNKQLIDGRTICIVNEHKSGKRSRSPKHKNNTGKVSSSNSTSEPKVFIVNLDKNVQETNMCDDISAYEQIEVLPSSDGSRVVLSNSRSPAKRPEVDQSEMKNFTGRVKSSPQYTRQKSLSHKSRVDQIKEGLLSKHNDKKDGLYSKAKMLGLQKMPSAQDDKNSRPWTPEKRQQSCDDPTAKKSFKTQDIDGETRSSQKPLLLKERLQTSGIVRNGIQRFENN